ncbi:IucA/IucC family protein [Glycomyces sp. NPDC046736]|uniref:IucA/IucC family protein n=1 Tax=Glycomyces sp. NPDC046736 TaxID=3155615 RepID=UPI0033CA83CD
MNATARADAIVADRLRLAAAREPVPGRATGDSAAEIAASLAAASPHAERFTAEIAAAVRGTALALDAAQPHPADLWAAAAAAHRDPSVWFEQAVLLGHPVHPLARSRGEWTDDQIRAWAPEHRSRFDLGAYAVEGLDGTGRDDPRRRLPVHPWQARRYGLGEPDFTWAAAPLMSVRTVSIGPSHIKTAVDLQLTSAVRHVSAAAAANGPVLSERLAPVAAKHGITLLPEYAIWARSADGTPLAHLSAIVRTAPHLLGHPRAVPLAALAEPCPATGRPIAATLAGNDLESWWPALVHVALAPLRLYAATGVALEAHGQNTLASFTGDTPTGLVYRDFGGIRVPPAQWPHIVGDLPEPDPEARLTKLLAALLPTTMTAIVTALADWTDTEPAQWWSVVASDVRGQGLPAEIADAVLREPWPLKATTAMRLADHPTDDLWIRVDNPLAAR